MNTIQMFSEAETLWVSFHASVDYHTITTLRQTRQNTPECYYSICISPSLSQSRDKCLLVCGDFSKRLLMLLNEISVVYFPQSVSKTLSGAVWKRRWWHVLCEFKFLFFNDKKKKKSRSLQFTSFPSNFSFVVLLKCVKASVNNIF